MKEKMKIIKIAITVLLVLLIISVGFLVADIVYYNALKNTDITEVNSNNVIEMTKDSTTNNESEEISETKESDKDEQDIKNTSTKRTSNDEKTDSNNTIILYKKNPEYNEAFLCPNMFPGDTEVRNYCVKVSYHNKASVNFIVNTRKGYEKLAEVMDIKVRLVSTDEILYEGKVKDIKDSVVTVLRSDSKKVESLDYEITVSLDTSVGNEYQNLDLITDFKWWVDEKENLDKAPKTGDYTLKVIELIIAIALITLCVMLLTGHKWREEKKNV